MWTTVKNYLIDDSTFLGKVQRIVWRLKNALLYDCPTPWTLLGWGNGSDDFQPNSTDPWFDFGDITTDDSWFVLENASGLQLILSNHNGARMQGRWTATGDYLASPGPWDDASPTVSPGSTSPPVDEVIMTSGNVNWTWSINPRLNIAMSDDGDSFIMASILGTTVNVTRILCKVEVTEPADLYPWYGFCHYGTGNTWTVSSFTGTAYGRGYNPSGAGNVTSYSLGGLYDGQLDIGNNIYVSPLTGNVHLSETLVVCRVAGSRHIRGKLTSMIRVPNAYAPGDTFNNGEFMNFGSYAIPWNDPVTPLLGI